MPTDAVVLRSDRLREEIVSGRVEGLRVFVLPKKGFRRKYAEIFVHYGSNDNAFVPPGGQKVEVPPGIAHFLEHKMFEKEWGEAFSRFASIGASANAFTTNNYTSYLFWTLDRWQEALELLFEVAFTPYFTPESVAKEQGIIGQEIRMYNDEPGSRMARDLLQALYSNHPVRLDIAGTEESIKQIDRDLLYLCHRTFYCPGNMSLFVAGDLNPDTVFESAANLMRRFARRCQGVPERLRPDEPLSVGKDVETHLPVPVPMLGVAWKDVPPGEGGPELVRQELAGSLVLDLLFGKSSDFFSQVYEEGLADHVSASYEAWPDYAFALVEAQTAKPEELADRIRGHMESARSKGIPEEDFARVKQASLGRFVTLFDSLDTVAEMQAHLDDAGLDIFKYGEILRDLRLEDVLEKLEHLRLDRSVRVIIRDGARQGDPGRG